MESLTEVTVRVFLALLKQWPETPHENHVKDAAKIARQIIDETDESNIRAKLHNLEKDYDSLHYKYQALQVRISEGK